MKKKKTPKAGGRPRRFKELCSATVTIRTTPAQKRNWIKRAHRAEKPLSVWIGEILQDHKDPPKRKAG